MDTDRSTLDTRAFGLACALLWSGAVVLGVTARIGWGSRWRRLLADVYRGYDSSAAGLLVGAAWAFLDGLAGGTLFAGLYNRLLDRRVVRADRALAAREDRSPTTD